MALTKARLLKHDFPVHGIRLKFSMCTILFKIITRMKLLFSIYLGGYSYSFQGSSELISLTVTVSLFFLAECITGNVVPNLAQRALRLKKVNPD